MRLTKNQREYIKRVRNAVRSIKGLLKKSDDFGYYQLSGQELPLDPKVYTKGYRLTKEEILASAPKRITKSELEKVSNKKVKSRLEFVVTEDTEKYGSGEILRGTQREFVKADYKKSEPKKKTIPNIPIETVTVEPIENITEQQLVVDHFLSEFDSNDTLGKEVIAMINDLVDEYGVDEIGYILRKVDTNEFWKAMERHPKASIDGVDDFRQIVIDEIPDDIIEKKRKEKLKRIADGNEEV